MDSGRARRVAAALATALTAAMLPGPAIAAAPAGTSVGTRADDVPAERASLRAELKPPKIVGRACTTRGGVTVVVDFRTLRNPEGKRENVVKIGCASGAQESGFSALLAAGFDVDPTSPFVCTINDRPINPPTCPPRDGFWSYSHGQRGGGWELSDTGAGGWHPPRGSLEGWSWVPYDRSGWAVPRVAPRDLFPEPPVRAPRAR